MKLVHGLRFDNLRGDLYGGLTAAVVALPLALAFGVSSGAGPVAGLYGAIFVGFFAALFGGTPAQVSGPTGPMTVVMTVVFVRYTAMFPDDPGRGAALAFTVVVLGGLFQVGFGLMRLGRFIALVPHPVISGFMSGIGIIIVLLQLAPLLGHAPQGAPLAAVQALPEMVAAPSTAAVTLGLITLAIVYLLPSRIARIVPAALVALVVGSASLTVLFAPGAASVLGDIPTGLPTPVWPAFELALLPGMIKSALVLAMLGAIDSLLTSLVADNVTRSHHDSDRELIGQGIGNTVAGLFGGLPGAGATMRTVVNIRAGGSTPLSGMIHALGLLVVVLGLGGFAAQIPHAVLAGILIKVGTDIVDWDYLKRLRRTSATNVVLMFAVMLTTVFVDLITAVAIGVVAASLIFMKRMTDYQLRNMNVITDAEGEMPLTRDERDIMRAGQDRIMLYHLSGPLSFSSAKGMVRRLAEFDAYEALVIDMAEVVEIDFSSARAVEDMIADAQAAGTDVFLLCPNLSVHAVLKRQGTLDRLPGEHVHCQRLATLEHVAERLGLDLDVGDEQERGRDV